MIKGCGEEGRSAARDCMQVKVQHEQICHSQLNREDTLFGTEADKSGVKKLETMSYCHGIMQSTHFYYKYMSLIMNTYSLDHAIIYLFTGQETVCCMRSQTFKHTRRVMV